MYCSKVDLLTIKGLQRDEEVLDMEPINQFIITTMQLW
jgi:hypothetical protein